ncbi:hypothetical protein GQ53DRAFT_821120 [Thozetella sp. PMI_491]|nr:hypothetical protein GQ53DRAFT_821120 [Thozetella sp. PMI_491]
MELRFMDIHQEREVLMCFIQNGADVYDQDDCGLTASEYAYANYWLGSYAGDLWDSVLAACGYEVASFRVNHPRRSKYTTAFSSCYTRDQFEIIWAGMEHLCPYYNNDESTSSSDNSESSGHDLESGSEDQFNDNGPRGGKYDQDQPLPVHNQHPSVGDEQRPQRNLVTGQPPGGQKSLAGGFHPDIILNQGLRTHGEFENESSSGIYDPNWTNPSVYGLTQTSVRSPQATQGPASLQVPFDPDPSSDTRERYASEEIFLNPWVAKNED